MFCETLTQQTTFCTDISVHAYVQQSHCGQRWLSIQSTKLQDDKVSFWPESVVTATTGKMERIYAWLTPPVHTAAVVQNVVTSLWSYLRLCTTQPMAKLFRMPANLNKHNHNRKKGKLTKLTCINALSLCHTLCLLLMSAQKAGNYL